MEYHKIKQKIFSLIPKIFQPKIRNFYYDNIVYPIYFLKYKINYGTWDFFDSIAIETTTYCNLRCTNCPNSKYARGLLENKKLMDITLFKKIINELAGIKYRGWILLHFYGDPLTDERLPNLVYYIKKTIPKSKIQINTNGFLLTISMYKKFISLGVKQFLITQYGANMPLSIKKIFEYLKTRPRKENKIFYRVLEEDLALSNRGGEIEVKKVADFERPICIYPNTAVQVDYFGNVILCCNDYHSSIKFGNLKNEKLIDIWSKPAYKKIRKELRKYIFKLPICRKCVGLDKSVKNEKEKISGKQ